MHLISFSSQTEQRDIPHSPSQWQLLWLAWVLGVVDPFIPGFIHSLWLSTLLPDQFTRHAGRAPKEACAATLGFGPNHYYTQLLDRAQFM